MLFLAKLTNQEKENSLLLKIKPTTPILPTPVRQSFFLMNFLSCKIDLKVICLKLHVVMNVIIFLCFLKKQITECIKNFKHLFFDKVSVRNCKYLYCCKIEGKYPKNYFEIFQLSKLNFPH
jgi:hypothetical protein